MNKQQLASKIWESANNLRSKIEANEYKDYILGFIFYKFLSNKEIQILKNMGLTKDEFLEVTESNVKVKEYLQNKIGYFISYENLFSTWIEMGNDFDISNVRDALSAFNRLINDSHKKVFEGIFNTLQTGLSKLGENAKAQTNASKSLIELIDDIPMDNKQDYDVLGFIYEYLISNFAANAGKKAGEFYTPHEVSLLMSEIIAEHLKDRENIEIYDPTSGSGSLLINIGSSASKFIKGDNKIKYFAQELKQNTYNLTRMNLVMRGILPENIITRNGDTLAEDWPFFDENHSYNPLFVDAVVSNPPYSQKWDPTDMDVDNRFKEYGIAPKGKADYAFLLHDLYHLNGDGIMTIVLPHGVLFRGGEEREIRKNLIEKNNIDTIIGLPANIFFGTGIPTIIMILKKNKNNTDIQIIDASKGFIKEGKNNKLRASDIKRIVDTVIERKNVEKFSKIVSREEIRENDYNLNIPRYVDSSEEQESYDIYASMFGGVPDKELNKFNKYWTAFPSLKNAMFNKINDKYYELKNSDITALVNNNIEIKEFRENISDSFINLKEFLKTQLIENIDTIDLNNAENIISNKIFSILNSNNLIDNYEAYQILDDIWKYISNDIELIQGEGIECVKKVDPNMVVKKKNSAEVQEGWKGHIIPFELIQKYKLNDMILKIKECENILSEYSSQYEEIFESLEDDKDEYANEAGDSFDFKIVANKVKEFKTEKIFIEENSVESKIIKVNKMQEKEKQVKKEIKMLQEGLEIESKKAIENLTNIEVEEMLEHKWIDALIENLNKLPEEIINKFIKDIEVIANKYNTTLIELENEITNTEKELANMLKDLTGNDYDMKGISEIESLLLGE